MRVVSLIASSTEILWALGYGDTMVGRSHECDFPERVKKLPVCTEPKFNIEGTSKQIDDRVKHALREGLSVYRVFPEKLAELKPDVILTQTHCEVCAVSLKDVEEAVCQLVPSRDGTPPRIVSLHPDRLIDIWCDIRKVAEALGDVASGERLVEELVSRMQKIKERAAAAPKRPRVAYIEWIEPLMAGGNWMPELVEMAGGENLFGEAGKHSPFMTWEEVVAKDPDVLFICPCGFDIPRTQKEVGTLTNRKEWRSLKAVREKRVFLADGNQYFNRPGPRVVESLEILAEVLHPGLFRFGYEGRGLKRSD